MESEGLDFSDKMFVSPEGAEYFSGAIPILMIELMFNCESPARNSSRMLCSFSGRLANALVRFHGNCGPQHGEVNAAIT